MREGRFRHLPVLQRGRLVGIVSDRDLTRRDTRTVGEAMRGDVITVTADTPVELAAGLMLDNKIGALPVVEDGSETLVGIVTQSDLFAVLARLLGGTVPSTRFELLLSDLTPQLAQVMTLAHEQHVAITSLITLPAQPPDARVRKVVLRIGTLVAAPFVSALRESGIAVDVPETQAASPAPTDA